MVEPTHPGPGGLPSGAALAQTIRDEEISPGDRPWWESTPADGPVEIRPLHLGELGFQARLGEQEADGQDRKASGRYRIEQPLGSGATGVVWAVHDQTLDRPVAVKVLCRIGGPPPDISAFVGEARIAASLQHPNVLPIHDLTVTDDGDPCFVMKRISGATLGQALRLRAEGVTPAVIANVNGLVSIFIAIAQALAYAHHHGVIHQDVKPDNILLGEFGEVILVDWGCAVRGRSQGGRLYGTPLYMSPEQARRDEADARSDLYCLGATLFHALIGRAPLSPEGDPAEFWRRKQSGDFDRPTPKESAVVPVELLAILDKTLAADAGDRYQTMDDALADLRGFQAGLAISAYREPWWRALGRWYRAHRTQVWTMAVALLLVGVAIGFWWQEKLRERSAWRSILSEDFAGPGVADRWRLLTKEGKWPIPIESEDLPISGDPRGGLVDAHVEFGFRNAIVNLAYRDRLYGDIRVDWTATMVQGNTNLNCFLGDDRLSGYTFHIGGWDDPTYCVLTRGTPIELLQQIWLEKPIHEGGAYRFRLERTGGRLRLWMDGQVLFDYLDHDDVRAVAPQSFGFDTWVGSRIAVDDIQLSVRPLPERISPLEVGEALARIGNHAEAWRHFTDLATAYPSDEIGRDAAFRVAISGLRLPERHAASAVRLVELARSDSGNPLAAFAWFELHQDALRRSDEAMMVIAREGLADFPGHPLQQRVLHAIGSDRIRVTMDRKNQTFDPGLIEAVEQVGEELLAWSARYGHRPVGNAFLTASVGGLQYLGRSDLVLRYIPHTQQDRASALLEEGRIEEARDGWSHLERIQIRATSWLGDWDRHRKDRTDPLYREAVLRSNDEALLATIDDPGKSYRSWFLLYAGREEELLGHPDGDKGLIRNLNLRAGRFADAVALDTGLKTMTQWAIAAEQGVHDESILADAETPLLAQVLVAVNLMKRGRTVGAEQLLRSVESQPVSHKSPVTLVLTRLVPAVLRMDAGDREGALRIIRESRESSQHSNARMYWHMAGLILKDLDEAAFRRQPARPAVDVGLPVCRAVRAELDGDAPAAQAAWREVAVIPLGQAQEVWGDVFETILLQRFAEQRAVTH